MKNVIQYFLTALLMCLLISINDVIAQSSDQDKTENPKAVVKPEFVKTINLEVKGMSCQAGCADGLDKLFSETNGIISSTTSFAESSSDITYDGSKISKKEIIKVIEARGFKTREIKKKSE